MEGQGSLIHNLMDPLHHGVTAENGRGLAEDLEARGRYGSAFDVRAARWRQIVKIHVECFLLRRR